MKRNCDDLTLWKEAAKVFGKEDGQGSGSPVHIISFHRQVVSTTFGVILAPSIRGNHTKSTALMKWKDNAQKRTYVNYRIDTT